MPDTSVPHQVAQFHLRDRLMRIRWHERRPVMNVDGWAIYVDPGDMPVWNAWIRRGLQIACVSTETWLILSGFGPALQRFIDDIVQWPKDGLIYLPIDGLYRDAAIRYSHVTGNDVVRGKDALTALEERAKRLLNHASDLVDHPHDGVLTQTVVSELIEVADDLADIEARLARLRAVVSVARAHAEGAVA